MLSLILRIISASAIGIGVLVLTDNIFVGITVAVGIVTGLGAICASIEDGVEKLKKKEEQKEG